VLTSAGVSFVGTDRPFEEAMGCLGVAPRGDEYVDDLPELVSGPVD
jgi:hypothetical protein